MKRLVIALIHNNYPDRNTYLRPLIRRLQADLSKSLDVNVIEVGYQPNLVSQSLPVGIYRNYLYWILGRQWSRYRELPNRFFLISVCAFLKELLSTYVIHPDKGRKWLHCCSIEMFLSDKHIRANHSALEMAPEYFLCLEDDAVFLPDTLKRFSDLLANIDMIEGSHDTPLYIDLGGGCSLPDLMIDNLEIHGPAGFRAYRLPVTNTACCYFLNRAQMESFAFWLSRNPLLRMIGSDWMMNKLLMLQRNDGVIGRCLHAEPAMFHHGSCTGEYVSSIRES
jgi:hypothetical protein